MIRTTGWPSLPRLISRIRGRRRPGGSPTRGSTQQPAGHGDTAARVMAVSELLVPLALWKSQV
jgi:hypothetical protein